MRLILLILQFGLALSLLAQPAKTNQSTLSIPQIMQGEKFIGYSPDNVFWSYDSKTIYFSWNPDQDTLRSLYKVDRDKGKIQKVSLEEAQKMPNPYGDYNKNRSKVTYEKYGDIYVLDLVTNKIQQLTNTVERENNPQFTLNNKSIIYQKEGNLFEQELNTGKLSQLTDFQKGNEKKDRLKSEQRQWLEEDQLAYFDVLRTRKGQREAREYRNNLEKPQRPQTIYTGKKSWSNLVASPDLNYITYRLTERPNGQQTDVPNFVTESGYTENLPSRAKVGSPQATYEMGIYDRNRDTTYILDLKELEGIYDKPAYYRDYAQDTSTYKAQFEEPREVIIHGPIYSNNGQNAVIVIRSMDNKDRWIMQLFPESGKLKLIDRQHDDAWIGGPGISGWNFSMGNIGWLKDNNTLWFQSEETGYSHLYSYNLKTATKTQLTKGDFEILDVQLSNDKQYFYLTSNKVSPHEHHYYRMSVKGGDMGQITSKKGGHQVTLSPDGRYLADRYSSGNQPWELFVSTNSFKAEGTQLTKSTTADFQQYEWRDPNIVRFTASDGAQVPARIYRPTKEKDNGAAIIFVHGAGYLQNVHHWWSLYYREYMFHNILADNGYTVLDIDYRASNGYGRDWRTGIYQFMGGKDLSDQVDGAKFLTTEYGVDAERIGIYGGSYGGFITLMAMFTEPGVFQSGAALRSVTDWAHYNHGYTSNILNTPVTDSIAYRKSSPIYHAEGLEGDLLILHGMIDQNVQFQDVVRLSQRLIELEKDNWELSVFPVERHGFIEPSSWADEYKRIFKLFEETLKK